VAGIILSRTIGGTPVQGFNEVGGGISLSRDRIKGDILGRGEGVSYRTAVKGGHYGGAVLFGGGGGEGVLGSTWGLVLRASRARRGTCIKEPLKSARGARAATDKMRGVWGASALRALGRFPKEVQGTSLHRKKTRKGS